MAKLIKVTSRNDGKYRVGFNGEKHNLKHFNLFANAIGFIEDKSYDMAEDAWVVDEDGLASLKELEEKLYPSMRKKLEKIGDVEAKTVSNWNDIGAEMKLQLYDYQKQVVK